MAVRDCAHCGDCFDGYGQLCDACRRYRSRTGELPPDEVLLARWDVRHRRYNRERRERFMEALAQRVAELRA